MMDKGQVKRVSLDEIATVKHFLESREDATLILRDFMLQFELDRDEAEFISSLPAVLFPVLRKMLMPGLVRDVPLTQQASMYSRLNKLEQLNPDIGVLHMEANDILIDYFEQEFANLESGIRNHNAIVLANLPNKIENDHDFKRVTNMLAYNLIIPIIEGRIQSLVDLVAPAQETPEERIARLKADSAE